MELEMESKLKSFISSLLENSGKKHEETNDDTQTTKPSETEQTIPEEPIEEPHEEPSETEQDKPHETIQIKPDKEFGGDNKLQSVSYSDYMNDFEKDSFEDMNVNTYRDMNANTYRDMNANTYRDSFGDANAIDLGDVLDDVVIYDHIEGTNEGTVPRVDGGVNMSRMIGNIPNLDEKVSASASTKSSANASVTGGTNSFNVSEEHDSQLTGGGPQTDDIEVIHIDEQAMFGGIKMKKSTMKYADMYPFVISTDYA